MKKNILLGIVLFLVNNNLFAQEDCMDKAIKLGVRIIELEKSDSTLRLELKEKNKQITRLQDVIEKNEPRNIKIRTFKNKIAELEKDVARIKNDTLGNGLAKYNLEKQTQKANMFETRVENLKEDSAAFSTAKKNIEIYLNSIKKRYNAPLEQLIQSSSFDRATSDWELFTAMDKGSVPPRLIELLKYKRAEMAFDEKFNKTKVEKEKSNIQPIMYSNAGRSLSNDLDSYESITKNVRNTFIRIQKDNSKEAIPIEELVSKKKDKVVRSIEDCIASNEIDLDRYTYLNHIITALKKRKMKNIDADIQDLIDQL